MSVANVVNNDIIFFEKSKKKIMELVNMENDKKWKFYNEFDDIKIYTKDINNGVCLGGKCVINSSVEKIIATLKAEKNAKILDSSIESVQFLDMDEGKRFAHVRYGGMYPIISKRDCVMLETTVLNSDKSQMIVNSKTDFDIFEKKSDCLRVDVISSGWNIVPLSNNKSVVYFLFCYDLKLNTDSLGMTNFMATKLATAVKKVKELV
jgi:hypothetical protein